MLKIKNLSKNFNKKKALININLEVKKGEVIGIIGPSGCGKSTLLRCINFLETPTSGTISFKGKEIKNSLNLTKIRQEIGMVFQQFNLFDNMTIIENIILAPVKLKLLERNQAIEKAEELLKKIDLLDKKDNYPRELSGGQKQRVAILRALIMEPEIMLFDEPVSSLDPNMTREVMDLIEELVKKDMTILIVSHELSLIKNLSDRIVFMDNGKIIEEGTPEEIYNNPRDPRVKDFFKNVKKG